MSKFSGYFFERVRRYSKDAKEIVINGYALDGYMDSVRPRAALFVGGKPVKYLKCRKESVKLPPIRMRRRNGDAISYIGFIYVSFDDLSDKEIKSMGSDATLVVIMENLSTKNRDVIYKESMRRVGKMLDSFNCSVDFAYVDAGKTYVKGWYAVDEELDISVYAGEVDELEYELERVFRDDVIEQLPERKEDEKLGFEMVINGEYKKLEMVFKGKKKKCTRKIKVDKSDDEFSGFNNITRYTEKIVRNLKNYGIRETISKVRIRLSPTVVKINKHYEKWLKDVSPTRNALEYQRGASKSFKFRPLLSILVPLYETNEKYLDELIKAIQDQTYDRWELCFSDGSKNPARLTEIVGRYSAKDDRIKYIAEEKGPLGISSNTNQAFSIAKGDFIVLGDHDDLITPDALFECVKVMNNDPDIDVIYTDEDKTNSTAKKRFEPNLKPDFNQELLESCNYITHMFVARKSLVDEVGLFDDEYNGAQDYDFILRCTEKAKKIYHIPKIVYSWRINETSTAGNPSAKMYAYDAGAKALQAHYERLGIKAKVEIGDHLGYYRSKYEIPDGTKLYVVVLNADEDEKYNRTVDSIQTKSDYKDIEFIRMKPGEKNGLGIQLNDAVKKIDTALDKSITDVPNEKDIYVCFIEAGVTMMGEEGLSGMLGYISNKPAVGAIGGKLYAVGGTVSHAGMILNMGELKGWMYTRHSKVDDMFFNYSAYSAIRRGIVIMRLSDLKKYGKFDESFKGEYAIIDYTYKMTLDGRRCIYDANAEFYIKPERGKDADDCFEAISQKLKEFRGFLKKHEEVIYDGDKFYTNTIRKIVD